MLLDSSPQLRAVLFGAGNIGRGFLAQLFYESGFEVIFVDVADAVVDLLNTRGEYSIHIVGEGAEEVLIRGVRAVNGKRVALVAEEIANAAVLCTAVGANALPYIAPALAEGLLLRHKTNGSPVNILLCENLHDASTFLRNHVAKHLPEESREAILAKTGFVQAVVSRMVPVQTEADRAQDPLAISVEAYKRLPIDANALVGALPEIVGVVAVPNFLAYVERKLYTHNCAHAVLGYVGHAKGYQYGYEALQDPAILALLTAVMQETGAALIRKHGFDPAQHQAHIADLLKRFENRALGDTCLRLARDPLRKLAPEDRLVGAARLCESQGVSPAATAQAIAYALHHNDPTDPATVRLQERIANEGLESALQEVCGILSGEGLYGLVTRYYTALES